MYHSQTKLQHLLPASDYWCETIYRREISELLKTTWHLVGTTAELSRPGDFLTCLVAETSLQVRNYAGQLRALSNICAHRHAELCSLPSGHASTMRCQYHGWEYQADGRTGKIPEPKNFVPLDRDALRLPSYALETVGQLVFVNVSQCPQPLREFLGDEFHDRLAERFSDDWVLSLAWQPEYGDAIGNFPGSRLAGRIREAGYSGQQRCVWRIPAFVGCHAAALRSNHEHQCPRAAAIGSIRGTVNAPHRR